MKKRVKPGEARRIMSKVPFNASFWLCTNDYLRSLRELAEALDKVDDDIFRYHVNRDKNDFEGWIREVVKDKELAREISRIKTRHTLVRKIYERLEELRSVLGAKKTKKKKGKKRKKRKRTKVRKKKSKKRKPRKKAVKKRRRRR
jgi:hypothetical protein